MRWPWRRNLPDVHGGQEAREKAERALAQIRAQTPYYKRLGDLNREIKDRNHWGETIAAIARKENPT